MTANKRKGAALAAAAAVIVAGAAALALSRQGAVGPDADGDAAVRQVRAAGPGAAVVRKIGDQPYWRALTQAQQVALQPLQGEWDGMDGVRKQKWLQLANRFGAMRPEEQQRVHARMREWVKLTPEQRELARETYTRTRKIAPEQKNATWQSYQQLSEEQKQKLAASAAGRAVPVVPAQANARIVPLGQSAGACPAGSVRNAVSATPPCVAAPAAPAAPAPNPVAPPAAVPAVPAPPAQPEKPVPANWGISPNNA